MFLTKKCVHFGFNSLSRKFSAPPPPVQITPELIEKSAQLVDRHKKYILREKQSSRDNCNVEQIDFE